MTYLVLIATVAPQTLRDAMLAAMSAAGLPTGSWTKKGFWENLINWIAQMLGLAFGILQEIARGALLSTATGNALTDLAAGTYGTPRRTATFAAGSVILSNASGFPLDEAAEAISFALIADPTVTYKNSSAVFILNGNQATVPIVCDIAGTVGNAAAGISPSNTIELTTTLVGVTLLENSAVAGQDDQLDEDLRILASKQASSLSTGHANKYEWFALNTNTDGTIAEPDDGKTRLNINRVDVWPESTIGSVRVILASPTGPVDAGEYTTAIAVISQYVLPNGVTLLDFNATAIQTDIDMTVELEVGSSSDGVEDEILTYLTSWFVSTANKIGGGDGFLTLDELRLLVGRANTNIRKVTIDAINGGAPANVTLGDDETATLGTVNITVVVQT